MRFYLAYHVKTGPMSANIQLGAAPQGAMIKLNATMTGGLDNYRFGYFQIIQRLGGASCCTV